MYPLNGQTAAILEKEMIWTDESQQMYYISKDNMPYAIHLPNIKDFDCSNEGIRIDEIYPNFTNWVKSNGNENTDWYLHKKE